MARFIVVRIVRLFVVLVAITVVSFGFMKLLPGDPAVIRLGDHATPEAVAALTTQLGLDKPWPAQLGLYLENVAHGNLGDSLQFYHSNASLIGNRLPNSAQLLLAAMALSMIIGLPLGVIAARREGSWWDRAASTLALLGQSVPVFWLALMAVLVFAVKLGWLPAGQTGKVKLSIHYQGPLRAPIAKGEQVAELEIAADGMRPSRVPLMAANDVPAANGFERLVNGIASLF